MDGGMDRRVQISTSMCAGLCAEFESVELLALPVDFPHFSLCDCNEEVLKYLVARFAPSEFHMFDSLTALTIPGCFNGHCYNHGHRCNGCLDKSDISFCGSPCQPFSTQSRGRELPDNHWLHQVTFGEGTSHEQCGVLSIAARQAPGCFVLENVAGFAMKRRSGLYDTHSPLELFSERMMALRDSDGRPLYTGTAAVKLDSQEWCDVHRPRFLVYSVIVWAHKSF